MSIDRTQEALSAITSRIAERTRDGLSPDDRCITLITESCSAELETLRSALELPSGELSPTDRELVVLLYLLARQRSVRLGSPTPAFNELQSTLSWHSDPANIYVPLDGFSYSAAGILNWGDVILLPASHLEDLSFYVTEYSFLAPTKFRDISWAMQTDRPFLGVRLRRTLDAISQDWQTPARRALTILRLVQMFSFGRPGLKESWNYRRITFRGESLGSTMRMALVNKNEAEQSTVHCLAPGNALTEFAFPFKRFSPVVLSEENLWDDLVVHNIGKRLKINYAPTEFEARFFSALLLFDKSYESSDPQQIILLNTMIIEALFNMYSGPYIDGITKSLSTNLSLLLTSDAAERERIQAEVTAAYRLRSRIVHNWGNNDVVRDVELSDRLALRSLALAAQLIEVVESREDLERTIKEGFQGIQLPIWGNTGRPPQ